MSRVFLSHSSRDNRYAVALKRWLEQAEPGLVGEIYLDIDPKTGIQTGVKWTEALWRVNARCEAVICLLSRSWAGSKECHTEYRQAEGMGKPIFCARIEEFAEEDITLAWQRCDLFGDGPATEIRLDDGEPPVRLSDDGLQRLLAGLRAVGIGADSFPWPPPGDPDRAPYRGWQPLESVDAAVYFGRDAQIQHGLDELRGMRDAGPERMFVILGPSGVGKSSFLRAGLLPRLDRDDRRFLPMTPVRPGRHALTGQTGLARSIHDLRTEVGLAEPSLGEIKNALGDAPAVRSWLVEAAVSARARWLDAPASAAPPMLVLPVDQAEELFGVDAGDEGPALLDLLGKVLGEQDPNRPDLILVATIRSDRYESLQTAPQLSALQTRLFDRLRAMPQAQFTEVICGPARRAAESGHRFTLSADLVDRLVQDASSGADTLPLMALTLARLYEDYAGNRDAVTVAHYEAMGGMRRVVQNEVDGVLAADPSERAEQLRQLHDAFIPWLATVNADTDQPMRRIARWADLPEGSQPLLDGFVGRRLLVKGARDGQVVVEVALESLLSQWDELAQWLRDEATDLRDADVVERAALAWERNGRNDDWLFDGTRLAGAETLSTKPGFGSHLHPAGEFLLASRQRVNRKLEHDKLAAEAHARSLRRRSQILVAMLAVIAVVAGFALISQHRARSAEQRATAAKLIGEARAMLSDARPGGDRRAILQTAAAETLKRGSDPDSLLNTVIDTRNLLKVITVPSNVIAASVSPDGHQIVSGGEDGLVRRWNLKTGEPEGDPLTGHTGKAAAAYVKDGQWIVSGGVDKTIRIWDAETSASVHVLTGQYDPARVASGIMSPDGALFAAGNYDGTVQLWDVATAEKVGEPIQAHADAVSTVVFSPDSSRLVTGGSDGSLRMWDVSTRLPVGPPLPMHKGSVLDVAFSPDGQRIASISYLVGQKPSDEATDAEAFRILGNTTQLRVTDAASGLPVVDGKTDFGYGGSSLAFSPDGRRIVIGSDDGKIRIHDANTGATIGTPMIGHTGNVRTVAYSPDGTRIVSAGDNTIHVWAAEPEQAIGRRLPDVAGSSDLPVAVSPDGHVVGTWDLNNNLSDIALWRVDTGERAGTISTGERGLLTALAWRPDGKAIASASSADNTIRMWNAQTGEPDGQPLTGPTKEIRGLYFSPDGRRLAALVVDSSEVWLWDTSLSPPRATVLDGDEDLVNAVGFSADGNRLMTMAPAHYVSGGYEAVAETGNVLQTPDMTPSAVRVWNTDTGEAVGKPITGGGVRMKSLSDLMALYEREDNPPISAAAISPDGQHLVVATMKGLRIHDVATGRPVGEPWIADASGAHAISILTYSPDGRFVVSVDTQTMQLQLWNADTGKPVGKPMVGHTGPVKSVAFTADGSHIASQGMPGWMLWPGPNNWRDELCNKVTDTMTRAEWDQWVSTSIDYQDPCPKPNEPR